MINPQEFQELKNTVEELQRKLSRYEQTTEPKRGEFLGQEWYNTENEVLYKWNGKKFTPAFGKEVINIATIIQAINNSAELIRINGGKIQLDGNVLVQAGFTLDSIGNGAVSGKMPLAIAQRLTVVGPNLFWDGIQIN